MLWLKLFFGLFCAVTTLGAQEIPAGTVLPVTLKSTLDARKDKSGEKIEARLMQDVPLPSGEQIKSGARVTGHIVNVAKPAGGGFRIVLKFDQLDAQGKAIPLNVSARAIAAADSVFQAALPIDAESSSESSAEWVTQQVGGDVVNRGRGLIGGGASIVGTWKGAAWGKLTSSLDGDCPAADGNDRVQALWVFSTSACGLYGLRDVKLAQAGRDDPAGQIVLESAQDVHIAGGSGWMLLVNAAPPTLSPNAGDKGGVPK